MGNMLCCDADGDAIADIEVLPKAARYITDTIPLAATPAILEAPLKAVCVPTARPEDTRTVKDIKRVMTRGARSIELDARSPDFRAHMNEVCNFPTAEPVFVVVAEEAVAAAALCDSGRRWTGDVLQLHEVPIREFVGKIVVLRSTCIAASSFVADDFSVLKVRSWKLI